MSRLNPWRLLKHITAEVAELKASLPPEQTYPPMCVVCHPVRSDPDGRPVGVYHDGREYVFAGSEPDPQVLAWLARPQNEAGQVPMVIVCYPDPISPPEGLDS